MQRNFARQENLRCHLPPLQDMILHSYSTPSNRLRSMLLILFGVSLTILVASVLRRPVRPWQRGILLLAIIMFLAVCVAWGIEYFLQRA